jgi:hypothetical protein
MTSPGTTLIDPEAGRAEPGARLAGDVTATWGDDEHPTTTRQIARTTGDLRMRATFLAPERHEPC